MEFKLQYKSLHVAIVLVMLLLTERVNAQVEVQPNRALLNEGDRTEIVCRYASEIHYCRIEIPGENVLSLNPKWNNLPGFTYFGKGLEAGECGVSIERVKGINNGQVKCSVGGEGQEFSGIMDLVVAIRPQQPIIELRTRPDRDSYFTEGTEFRARCIARDGRPPANISWLLDGFPADKSLGPAELSRAPNGLDNGLDTITQEIYWHLAPEDNNRKLICRAHHQTDREDLPPQEAAVTLHVRYAPARRSEPTVYGLYLDHTALVNLTIRANPAPVVEWNVGGKIISQGQQNGRFSAYEPIPLGQDYYNVTLAIAGLTAEDTAQVYHVRASNALGTTDYQVRVSSSSTPPIAGLNVAAIVGIVVAICVLIIVALLFVFAKVTNRWCFGEKSLKTAKPETSLTAKETNGVLTRQAPEHEKLLTLGQPQIRRSDVSADESFEYNTDRESSVYNATTIPLNNGANELLKRGNQIGIPEARSARCLTWLPKDQRELLEKQAKLLLNRTNTTQDPPPPKRTLITETEI